MQGFIEQKPFTQIFAQNALLLRLLADYYKNFVYAIPERLFLQQEPELQNKAELYEFLCKVQTLVCTKPILPSILA